jgi:hypothetical protein
LKNEDEHRDDQWFDNEEEEEFEEERNEMLPVSETRTS